LVLVNPAEDRLQQIQAERSLILDNVYDAIALLDAEQRLVLFNDKLVQMWGLTRTWLDQQPTLQMVLDQLVADHHWTPDQRDAVLATCTSASGRDSVVDIHQQNQTYLELSSTATSNGGRLLILRDVSVQRRYQNQLANEVRRLTFLLGLTERLQSSEDLQEVGTFALRYLVEAMGAAFGDVKVISGQGKQRRAGALTNLISGQFIATYGEGLVEDMEAVLNQGIDYGQGLLWQVVESGKPLFVEDYAQHPKAVKGFCHPAIGQLGIFPIPSADGSIIGVVTLESRSLQKLQEAPQQDILLAACRTLGAAIERAQSQARLQHINQDLERASRLKSEFLASMSHELRTPLNSILGFSELVLRKADGLGDRQTSHIRAIRQSGEHLLHLINDILDLSKVEAGRVDITLQTVSIQSLCRQCLQMIQPRADRKRLTLSLEMDYGLDQVTLDERRVRQIVINLLSNAVKFTPEKGRIKLSVRLAYGNELDQDFRPDDSPINPSTPYLCLQVKDNGIGIAPEKQPLLFRPFQQIDSSLNRRHDGTGLGLALTKRMAELHGGTVSLRSVCGEGSTFRVWLPLNELRNGVAHTGAVSPSAPNPSLPFQGETAPKDKVRVLVVEDHPYNQTLISEAMELEGFEVELVSDGQTMWDTIHSDYITAQTLPDIVLMDIQLPGVDGLQLIQAMRSHPLWQPLPIIAVTAMAMAGDRDRCLAAGADDYISKPLDFEELGRRVRSLLDPSETAEPADSTTHPAEGSAPP
jgi:signal transduction histidine kinase/FixJ family two-component response regulator